VSSLAAPSSLRFYQSRFGGFAKSLRFGSEISAFISELGRRGSSFIFVQYAEILFNIEKFVLYIDRAEKIVYNRKCLSMLT